MGLYATLQDALVECRRCGAGNRGDWQFYYGEVSSLPRYRVGDTIRWDGSPQYGGPATPLVFAVAYPDSPEACSHCGAEFLCEVRIDNGRIVDCHYLTDQTFLPELVYEGTERIPRSRKDLAGP